MNSRAWLERKRDDVAQDEVAAKRNTWKELQAAFPDREKEFRDVAARLGISGVTVERSGQTVASWGDTDGHHER